MSRAHGCAGAAGYRMYVQKTAPAFSARPPTMTLVLRRRIGSILRVELGVGEQRGNCTVRYKKGPV